MKKVLIVLAFALATTFFSCTGGAYVSTGVSYGGFGSYGGYGGYYGGYGSYGYRSTVNYNINRGYYGGGYRRYR